MYKHICPTCSGIGLIFAALRPISIKCETCNGTGLITNKKQLWIKQGSHLRNYRLTVLKLGLREFCRKYNIDPSHLSKMERGLKKPVNIYRKLEVKNNENSRNKNRKK